jgi:uncharacterized protein
MKILLLLTLLFSCTANQSSPHPGASTYSPKLLANLNKMKVRKGKSYRARTRHITSKGDPKYTNRLFLETSPYLLQHAHNPVNWYPWGDEAFELAKRLNRPVLMSIGYSTCHWCHVMEEESFEDVEIAKYINENYIAIKVDREERPDVDAVYMAALQAIKGSGGWPMTVWLAPNRKPLYAASYIPARDGDRGVQKGFLSMLDKFNNIYKMQPEKIKLATQQISAIVKRQLENTNSKSELAGAEVLETAANYYKGQFDDSNGGLKGSPKFPSSLSARFLLRYFKRSGEQQYLKMVKLTLKKMAGGGMYDHVAGGFHRYSTDKKWLVPHFEKMLYDNALLVVSYVEAYQMTKDEEYKRVAKEILDYISSEMTNAAGAFYSATDADSIGPKGEREEGLFFTWTPSELDIALSAREASLVKLYYGVTNEGNFEHKRSILNTALPLSEIAATFGLTTSKARELINNSRVKLHQQRSRRPTPIRDEKIITAWNGLMISAFAKASFAFNDDKYLIIAKKAASFIETKLQKNGRLLRSYKDEQAKHNGYADDYAFYISALIDLYEASSEIHWLSKAIRVDQTFSKFYEDKENGGFFTTGHDHEKLIAREKPAYDGAIPSANSVAALNLLRLSELTTDDNYRKRAVKLFKAFSLILKKRPIALAQMLLAWDFYLSSAFEIIIVKTKDGSNKLVKAMQDTFIPHKIISIVNVGDELNAHSKVIKLLEGKVALKGKTTAYVCRNGSCKFPTTKLETFLKQIKQ